jgi:hypothetical protein
MKIDEYTIILNVNVCLGGDTFRKKIKYVFFELGAIIKLLREKWAQADYFEIEMSSRGSICMTKIYKDMTGTTGTSNFSIVYSHLLSNYMWLSDNRTFPGMVSSDTFRIADRSI